MSVIERPRRFRLRQIIFGEKLLPREVARRGWGYSWSYGYDYGRTVHLIPLNLLIHYLRRLRAQLKAPQYRKISTLGAFSRAIDSQKALIRRLRRENERYQKEIDTLKRYNEALKGHIRRLDGGLGIDLEKDLNA